MLKEINFWFRVCILPSAAGIAISYGIFRNHDWLLVAIGVICGITGVVMIETEYSKKDF